MQPQRATAPVPERQPRVSRGAARWASRSLPPQRRPAVVEDRHNAASYHHASHGDTILGAEFQDPETEETARAEEEAYRVDEADPPQEAKAEDPLEEGQERRRE